MLKISLSITAAAALGAGLIASAPAQSQSNSRGEIIVYGDDPCPRAADDEVVVCVRRPAEERYRIPQAYRPGGTRQQSQSWAAQSRPMLTVGNTGTESCSPVGPGGHTGCLAQEIQRAKAEAEETRAGDTPPAR